jgi:hypothetical protein
MALLGLRNEPPLVRARIAVASGFFRCHSIPQQYLKGIDYSHDVREVTLNPGFHLIAYRAGPLPGAGSWNPYGLFYTEVGTSAYEVGIKPDRRIFVRYIVSKSAKALRSRAAGVGIPGQAGQGPRYLAGGGGWQYVIPGAEAVLRRI